MIRLGSVLSAPRWRLPDRDVSFGLYIYGFPVQQAMVMAGAAVLPVPLFAAVSAGATLPLAAASWLAVERPALRMRAPSGVRRRADAPALAVASNQSVGPRA